MFDCIIVGAGPAGASAAYHLAKKERSVLVLEKSSLPRYKPCGGGVSPAVADWFDFDFTPVIRNTVSKVRYTWQLGDPMEVELKEVTPMWMVKRDEFDNFLIEKATAQGVQLKDNTEVTGIKLQGDKWQVNTSNGVFEGAYLIAADGVNGSMADWLGFEKQQKVPAASLEVEAEVSGSQNLAYFDFGSLKNGFMWCFPKDNGYSFSAAYMRNHKGKPEELKKQLINYANKLGLNPSNSKYTEYYLNVWQEDLVLHTNRAVIAGEAAGIVDPLIGEGIRPAMFTGVKAAEAVTNALDGNPNALAQYTETVHQQWGSDLVLAQRLAGLFYQFPKIAYKVGVKRPSAGQLMGKILCGELRYSDVTEQATKKLKASFIPGFRG